MLLRFGATTQFVGLLTTHEPRYATVLQATPTHRPSEVLNNPILHRHNNKSAFHGNATEIVSDGVFYLCL
jgi:hypothetical protein